jgi:hypothetical protein
MDKSDRVDLGGGWWTQSPEALAELTRRHNTKGRKRRGWRTSVVVNTDLYRTGRRK